MTDNNYFDIVIVGGSYSGLAAAMTLGRSLRKVLIIDSGKPCNRTAPFSHNFLTQDGKPPKEISTKARAQVAKYDTVTSLTRTVTEVIKNENGFTVTTDGGQAFVAKKIIFATGIRDIMPEIPGFAPCWGISVLHCPYCHGYEEKNETTGVLANGDFGFEFAMVVSNWTKDLTLYTNGQSILTHAQTITLLKRNIKIVETGIERLEHDSGVLKSIVFNNQEKVPLKVLYARCAFVQHCDLPGMLGCAFTEDGYIEVDNLQKTNVYGVYACGDNSNRLRAVANAVSAGTTAGMAVNKELIVEYFKD